MARVGPGLVADGDREHDAVVGIPRASGRVGDRGIVDGRDAAPGAHVRVAELPVVDQHPAPADETPVDVGVGVVEERLPSGFEQREQPPLVSGVAVEGGEIPCDQVIGDGLPPAQLGHGVVGHPRAGQLLEGRDRRVVEYAAPEESEEVRDDPGQPRVSGLSEADDRGRVDSDLEAGPDGLEVVDGGLCDRARRRFGRGRELVSEVVPQSPALSRTPVGKHPGPTQPPRSQPPASQPSAPQPSVPQPQGASASGVSTASRATPGVRGTYGVGVGARTGRRDECESDQQATGARFTRTTLEGGPGRCTAEGSVPHEGEAELAPANRTDVRRLGALSGGRRRSP